MNTMDQTDRTFMKMHGLGNDFVVLDTRKTPVDFDAVSARAISDRRLGIGCDQILIIEAADSDAEIFMRILNADGSEAEACGNGTRCVAALMMAETGNANALKSYLPEENDDRYQPITYGSSHIQAIAFRKKGAPIARTILTYSQSEDPTSRFHADQTRLFSQEKWVRFAWTGKQIRKARIGVTRLR